MFDLPRSDISYQSVFKKQTFFLSKKKKIKPGAPILRQNLEKKGVDLSLGIFQGECPGHYQRQNPSTPRLCRVSWGARIKKYLCKSKERNFISNLKSKAFFKVFHHASFNGSADKGQTKSK